MHRILLEALVALTGLDGKSFPSNLGTEFGESRSKATAVAPASVGSDADQDHESAAGHCHERRPAVEEKAVGRTGASAVGEVFVVSLGQSAPARPNGATGPIDPYHRGIDHSRHTGRIRKRRIRLLGFPCFVFQPTLDNLAGCRIQHGNLLEARVKVTAYNQHPSAPFPRALVAQTQPSLLGRGEPMTLSNQLIRS